MSATVDAQRFSSYLGGAPVLMVPGRMFPVETMYLEDAIELTGYIPDDSFNSSSRVSLDDIDADEISDITNSNSTKDLQGAKYSAMTRKTLSELDEYRINYDLIIQLIEKVATDSRYIRYSKAILVFLPGIAEIKQLNDILLAHPSFTSGWIIYPLHSIIAGEEQERAFITPSEGVRKIVLATNIAETGDRHNRLLAEQQTPEILRLSLQDLILRVKTCKLGDIEKTLSEALDPPLTRNIRRAIDALIDVALAHPTDPQ
ncbi:hypothetical protein GP486_001972 [Trichoglossum hirsutum]|uniref:Uncharacterized protein n=1 Tax=Trichoglossum hirsutum TaxID=265104 RepID=A0A9P8RSK0_9PEZI|nr:hypothetical protein GP486_001972 [Trichoglossum hirsutum]